MKDIAAIGASTIELLTHAALDAELVTTQVQRALDEDLLYGPDVTTSSTVPTGQSVTAAFVSRKGGVVSGLPVVAVALDLVVGPDNWRVSHMMTDADALAPGDEALTIEAPTVALLTAERTALNFLCHLSGVATLTAKWVSAVAGTGVRVRDTRKTTPGMRVLEKYAVRCGGGMNHRMGLGDAALVKDNHVVAAGGVAAAVHAVRAAAPSISLEVECDSLTQVQQAVAADVELVLLDNMSVNELSEVVQWVRATAPQTKLEASGGLTLDTVAAVAGTGVDYVAVGALTHSAPTLDIGLDVRAVLGDVETGVSGV